MWCGTNILPAHFGAGPGEGLHEYQTIAGFVRFAHFDDHGSLARAATATWNV